MGWVDWTETYARLGLSLDLLAVDGGLGLLLLLGRLRVGVGIGRVGGLSGGLSLAVGGSGLGVGHLLIRAGVRVGAVRLLLRLGLGVRIAGVRRVGALGGNLLLGDLLDGGGLLGDLLDNLGRLSSDLLNGGLGLGLDVLSLAHFCGDENVIEGES